MINLRKCALSAALLGASALIGCGGGYYSAGVVVGPPPPEPYYGPVGYAPGPGFIWVGGFYDLQGGHWIWRNGYWARPPHPGYVWARPHWERRPNGRWRFHKGYWQHG